MMMALSLPSQNPLDNPSHPSDPLSRKSCGTEWTATEFWISINVASCGIDEDLNPRKARMKIHQTLDQNTTTIVALAIH